MTANSRRWQDYPYLVEWVAQMIEWAANYQIYEYVPQTTKEKTLLVESEDFVTPNASTRSMEALSGPL